MSIELKAAQLLEEPRKLTNINQTTLIPLNSGQGYVFAICSIPGVSAETQMAANLLGEHGNRLAQSFDKQTNAQHSFEQFLVSLNDHFAHEVKSGTWSFPIEDFAAIVGIIKGREMYLSGTGDITAIFLHKTPQGRYQVFNLARSIQTEQALPTWEKPFAVLLDGDLKEGDVFCLSNQDLQRVVPQQDLNSVLATLPPKGSTAKIRQYFPAETDLVMLVLQQADKKAPTIEEARANRPSSEASLNKLEEMKDTTEELLEDQKPTPVRSILRKAKSKKKKSQYAQSTGKRTATTILRAFGKASKKVFGFVFSILKHSSRSVTKFSADMVHKNERENRIKEARSKMESSLGKTKISLKNLPVKSKYLAGAGVLVLVILVASLSLLSKSQARQAVEDAYTDQVANIEQIISEAEAAAIYKNEDQARLLFNQAEELLSALPQETPVHVGNFNRLSKNIDQGMDELRKIVNIIEPPTIATLDQSASSIVRTPSALLTFSEGKIDRVLINDKLAEEFFADESILASDIVRADSNLYSITDSTIQTFDLVGKSKFEDLSPEEGVVWKDMFAYNARLYVLQTAPEAQILRFNITSNGFSSSNEWLESTSTDLSDATSLSVDGTIFVLKENGEIARFERGSEIGWEISAVEPAIQKASKLWTDIDSRYVYILADNRVIVFDKNSGKLLMQYSSAKFTNITDFAVDEGARTIYLLNGDTVFGVNAGHL